MQMVRAFSALLLIIGSDAMETGEALRNRGADSFAEVGVGRKVTRRVRKHATGQLVSEETTRNEVPGGTGAMPPATPI